MSGTKEGFEKMRQTMIERLGGIEEWKAWMRERGRKGGQGSRGYPFGHGKVDPSVIGRVGGRISRRGPKNGITQDN